MWSGICGQIDIRVILMYNPDSLLSLHDRHLQALAKDEIEQRLYCAALVTSSWHSLSFQGQRLA